MQIQDKPHSVLGASFAISIILVLMGCAQGSGYLGKGTDVPHVVFIIHEDEYDAKTTMPVFGRKYFEEPLGWKCTYVHGEGDNSIPGIDALDDADLAVIYVRRKPLPPEQLAHLKQYVASGKPLIGLRTASHGFVPRGALPEGVEAWPEFDPDVLGGHYDGHFGNKSKEVGTIYVNVIPAAREHPIMKGVRSDEFRVQSRLYKTKPLVESATLLMLGRVDGLAGAIEPVSWTNWTSAGGRVFYTSLGHPEDFAIVDFRRMLVNAVFWALDRRVPRSMQARVEEPWSVKD